VVCGVLFERKKAGADKKPVKTCGLDCQRKWALFVNRGSGQKANKDYLEASRKAKIKWKAQQTRKRTNKNQAVKFAGKCRTVANLGAVDRSYHTMKQKFSSIAFSNKGRKAARLTRVDNAKTRPVIPIVFVSEYLRWRDVLSQDQRKRKWKAKFICVASTHQKRANKNTIGQQHCLRRGSGLRQKSSGTNTDCTAGDDNTTQKAFAFVER
jgi:hypothetical protein